MEDGTDDYYSNILLSFYPISGFDPYMTQGSATAKPYMKQMLDAIAANTYGDKLLKTFGSDFKDSGDHYSMTGYLWLDGSVFSNGPSQPIRGCIEVRYYGPIGYALVAMTVSMESRIRNYFEICNAMLDTFDFTAGWSTAPKPVPARPSDSGKSTGSPGYSGDSGDYAYAYYWYDEDGDIWYFDGYDDYFVGFGDDYYIDDYGGCYSYDDYWDDWYDDYDYYDDYDPWDDYDDDGWDDWDDYDYDWDDWYDYDDYDW